MFSHDHCYQELAAVPARPVAIALGARTRPDGTPGAMYEDRLVAALALHQAGKVQTILVSGSALTRHGDEATAGRRFLLERGLAEDDLLVDPAAHRTRLSMSRAGPQFGIASAVICTQAFHLPRSLYLARAFGLDAVGFVADRRAYPGLRRLELRERAAQLLAVVEVLTLPCAG